MLRSSRRASAAELYHLGRTVAVPATQHVRDAIPHTYNKLLCMAVSKASSKCKRICSNTHRTVPRGRSIELRY